MSILSEGLKSVMATGFTDYVEELTGKKPKDAGGWVKSKAKGTFNDAAMGFIKDRKVQEQGRELVKHTLKEGVETMKTNFSPVLADVEGWTNNSTDIRSTYQKARDLLGNNASDKWYTKILKSAGAGVLSFTVPIASFVSTLIAVKFTGENKKPKYHKSFTSIFSGLLGLATKPKVATP